MCRLSLPCPTEKYLHGLSKNSYLSQNLQTMSNNTHIPVTLKKRGPTDATGTLQLDIVNDLAVLRKGPVIDEVQYYVVILARPLNGKSWNVRTLTIEESPAEVLSLRGSYDVEAPLVQFTCTKVDTCTLSASEEILINMKYARPEAFGDGSKIYTNPDGEANTTVYVVNESPEEILEETGGSSGS